MSNVNRRSESEPGVELDVRGSCCPMPLVQLAKVVHGLGPAECIEVVGDDPIFELGVREFCMARGFTVESKVVDGREVRLRLRAPVETEAP